MRTNEFTFVSRDGKSHIHVQEWIPDEEPKAILQICHGMNEYIGRYDRFGQFLAENGFYVVGHDHLGHGKSVANEEELGWFDDKLGNEYLIADIHRLRGITQEKYRSLPYFMMGHSMGSFLIRQYMQMHGDGLFGVIVMGTGSQSSTTLAMGRMMCKAISLFKGWHYRSQKLEEIAFGSYNKNFEPVRTQKDWLTKDEQIVDRYIADPLCMFRFTVSAYNQMFRGIQFIQDKNNIAKIPKRLPVFLVSGGDDPVGNCGEGVQQVYESFHAAGMLDVLMKLYPGDRHEILNELNYRDVQDDLLIWMLSKLSGIPQKADEAEEAVLPEAASDEAEETVLPESESAETEEEEPVMKEGENS